MISLFISMFKPFDGYMYYITIECIVEAGVIALAAVLGGG
jgi:hypothetical protein